MFDILNLHAFPIVHTGTQYTEQFLSDCVDNGYTWCGNFAAAPIQFRKSNYLSYMQDMITRHGDNLCIFLDKKYRAFYFVGADVDLFSIPKDQCLIVEYEDLIENNKADFSDFDSFFSED